MRYENKGSNFRGRKRHAASGPRPREVSRFPTSFPPPPHPFARSCNSLFARTKRRKMADFGPAPPKLGRVTRHKANLSLNSFPTFAIVCSTTQFIYFFIFLFFSFISRDDYLFSLEIRLILIRLKKENCSDD